VLKRRISIQSAKSKGRELQKYIASRFSEITGIKCGKDCLIQSREMGQSGTDVKVIGDALKVIPFSIEAKRQESWSVHSWIKQAKENQLPETDWLLFARRNRDKAVVFMEAETFFKLFEKLHRLKQNADTPFKNEKK
jgi:hypothetical protein